MGLTVLWALEKQNVYAHLRSSPHTPPMWGAWLSDSEKSFKRNLIIENTPPTGGRDGEEKKGKTEEGSVEDSEWSMVIALFIESERETEGEEANLTKRLSNITSLLAGEILSSLSSTLTLPPGSLLRGCWFGEYGRFMSSAKSE
jgi:hypothetical protein